MILSVTEQDRLIYTLEILSGETEGYSYKGWCSKTGHSGSIEWLHPSHSIWSYDWRQEGKYQVHRRELLPRPNSGPYVDIIEIRGHVIGSGSLLKTTQRAFSELSYFEALWDQYGHGTSTIGDW